MKEASFDNVYKYLKMSVLIVGLLLGFECYPSQFVSTMKGIGSDFEDFGKKIGSASFWKSIGMGFGAAPTGYVYSYTVINDTPLPIYVDTQQIVSVMGACFPKADGWQRDTLQPFEQTYTVKDKEYYFEMLINAGDKPSNRLPYVHNQALYVQDCIQLGEKNSTKMNYFHVYMGKNIVHGNYVHVPKAEYVGYSNPSDSKDKGASVAISSVLTGNPAITIYNSTKKDLLVGYSSKQQEKSLSKKDCDVFFTDVLADSFVFHSPLSVAGSTNLSLPIGTVGVFEKEQDQASEVLALPLTVFGGKKYTIEIYQDEVISSVKNGADSIAAVDKNDLGQRSICIQGLMSEYDAPVSRVRDITPITCVFWYQSVAQLDKSASNNMIDLPGQVWIVSKSEHDMVQTQVPIGSAVQFSLVRPNIGSKRWVYFLYVDIKDGDDKGKEFVDKFAQGKIGADIIAQYEQQSIDQFNQTQKDLSNVLTFKAGAKGSAQDPDQVVVPESLLVAALQGALKVNRGQIQDNELQVQGYLLGADVFLPQGVGANSTMYYEFNPSMKTSGNVPTSSVTNGYIMGISKAPKGMPQPTIYGGEGQKAVAKQSDSDDSLSKSKKKKNKKAKK